MTDTLARWGTAAFGHTSRDDKHVILSFDGCQLKLGPVEDETYRKALQADVVWIIAKAFETGSAITQERFERQEDLIRAGERLVAVVRNAHEAPKGYSPSRVTLDLCLTAYDLAKANLAAPSVYERLRDPASLDGEPAKRPGSPPIPEPETEALHVVLAHWMARRDQVHAELDELRKKYVQENPAFDNKPCPDDLARAYDRFFKAKTVVSYLRAALDEQLGQHLVSQAPDGSGELPTEFRMRLSYAFASTKKQETSCDVAIEAEFRDLEGGSGGEASGTTA